MHIAHVNDSTGMTFCILHGLRKVGTLVQLTGVA